METTSLDEGASEVASVLFLNLQGFVPYCQGLDPGDVMRTLNQIMADLTEVLERHRGFVTSYLGGGFMALIRGHAHAERAIVAALDMMALVSAFNRPRAVLGLRQLPVRIGIASGGVFLGNIGTYYKLDFTAVGMPVNLSARLMRQGDNQRPCISLETYEMVRDRFEFASGNPRVIDLSGIGRREVWDVIGRKKEGRP
jgi:adenylate cyclase